MGAGEGERRKKLLYHNNEQQRTRWVSCDVFLPDSLPSHSYLGPSADGIIDPQRTTEPGVLEIKCPVSDDGESILDWLQLTLLLGTRGFICTITCTWNLPDTTSTKHKVKWPSVMQIGTFHGVNTCQWRQYLSIFHSMSSFGNVKCYLNCTQFFKSHYLQMGSYIKNITYEYVYSTTGVPKLVMGAQPERHLLLYLLVLGE